MNVKKFIIMMQLISIIEDLGEDSTQTASLIRNVKVNLIKVSGVEYTCVCGEWRQSSLNKRASKQLINYRLMASARARDCAWAH